MTMVMKGCNHTTGYVSAFGAVFMAMDYAAAAAMKCGRPRKFSFGRWKTTEKWRTTSKGAGAHCS